MWLSSTSKSSGVKKRSPKTSAMALSAATLESLFPAPTPRRVSVIRGIDPQIMTICPPWGCLPEIIGTVEDTRVVDGHHFVAAKFDGQLLYDSPAQVLIHGHVGIFTVQRDGKGQPCGSGDNHIVFAKFGESDKKLLVLVDAARIVGDDQRLPHPFDTQGLAEGAVRIKLAPKLTPSHYVLKLCDTFK